MKLINKSSNSYILRLDAGGEFISSVQDFCKEKNIKAGWIEAIGSTKDLELSYFNIEKKEYDTTEFTEFLEAVTISGNISGKEGSTMCHAHGIFSRRDLSTIAGHIKKCVISATMEVFIYKLDGDMNREFDDKTGLHLLT